MKLRKRYPLEEDMQIVHSVNQSVKVRYSFGQKYRDLRMIV